MTHPLVTIAGLCLYLWGWNKFGFRKATLWACLIVMSIYPLAFTGMLLPPIFRFLGVPEPTVPVRIAVGVVVIGTAMIAAKHLGWGKVLAGTFQVAMVVSAYVILGFLLLVTFAAVVAGHL